MVRQIVLSLLLCFFMISNAQEKISTKKAPTVITADKAEYYSKERLVVYKGNVEVNRGELYMKADSVRIMLDEKSDISRIVATGNVYFKQNNRWGKSNEAEYIKDQDVIVLRGKAEVHQDKNSVEGEVIYYYITEERAVSTGQKERVRSIFFPKESGDR